MRLVKAILTSLAVLAGVIIAAFLMVIGLVVFFILRLFGRPAKLPVFRASMRRPQANASQPRANRIDETDVIDVVATEVKD